MMKAGQVQVISVFAHMSIKYKVLYMWFGVLHMVVPDFVTEKTKEAFRQYYKQHGTSSMEKPFVFHSPSGKGPYDSSVCSFSLLLKLNALVLF